MDYRIFPPRRIVMEVPLPASKSISNRMLILNALGGGELHNVAECDDTSAMRSALGTCLDSGPVTINIGAAGTAMRFLTAFFASREGCEVTLDGSERMRHRPIALLVDALRRCGAIIEYAGEEGFPPLRISGRRLHAERIEIAGNVSSQYISALLMVAPLIGCRTISLTGQIISLPYIHMTLSLMRLMGVDCTMQGSTISLPADAHYRKANFSVESDWSAASYWFTLQALLPESQITLLGLHLHSTQGDSAISSIFSRLSPTAPRGTSASLCEQSECSECSTLSLNLSSTPDLAQTIVVAACLLGRHFHISGLQTLRIKETDRIEALCSQLRRLGFVVAAGEDFSLSWDGERCTPEEHPHISTFDDHRMAMAFAPAAVMFPGLVIDDIEVVSKSYPDFWKHLAAAGFSLTPCERGKEVQQ
ncbi:MAG: 3-phosphoshikimate 1-carboxyvinyltransferase [Bacteroidales bacterium]|nr:3-phosphoshikimate 1-carboxyvinyltransferase [Bacteroidales bacterium]